jgi:acyl-CoA thioesterase FadM
VTLNGNQITLAPTADHSPHTFLELLNHTNFDMSNAVGGYTLLLNNQNAGFSDPIKAGDTAVIEIIESRPERKSTQRRAV